MHLCVCVCIRAQKDRDRDTKRETDRYTKIIENNITKTPTFHTQNKHVNILPYLVCL